MDVAIALEFFHRSGGVEKRTSMLVRELLRRGQNVQVITRGWTDAFDGRVSCHRVSGGCAVRALKPLVFAASVHRTARRLQPDILHAQTRLLDYDVVTLGVGCHRAFVEARTPPGQPIHLDAFDRVSLWLEKRMLKDLTHHAVIANSSLTQRNLQRFYGVDPARVRVIHNGVDVPDISDGERQHLRDKTRTELGLEPGQIMVLFLGGGWLRKGLKDLIAASAMLPCHLRVVVVGSGNQEEYSAIAAQTGAEIPIFAGQREGADRFYYAADIFALPTLYDPFANSTMEALAAGLPVITTTSNGVSEILTDGANAFCIPARSPETLAGRIQTLADDPSLRRHMGSAGSEVVREYTWERTARETWEVYQSVLSGKRK